MVQLNSRKRDGEKRYCRTLAGVSIQTLYKSNSEVVEEDIQVNDSGYINIENLEYGSYYFTEETAPEGYVKQSGKYHFTISKSGTINKAGDRSWKS